MKFSNNEYYDYLREKLNNIKDEKFISLWNLYCDAKNKKNKIYENNFASFDLMFESAGKFAEWIYNQHDMVEFNMFNGKYISWSVDGKKLEVFDEIIEAPGFEFDDLFSWIWNNFFPEQIEDMINGDYEYSLDCCCDLCHTKIENGEGIIAHDKFGSTVYICNECKDNILARVNA